MPRPVRAAQAPLASAGPSAGVEPTTSEPGVKWIAIEPAGEAACVFEHEEWAGTVHIRPDGPAFANIEGAPASLSIPVDGKAARVKIRGRIDLLAVAASPEIFLAKPIALGGFIVPFAETSLTVAGPHKTGHLNVSLDISDLFELPPVVAQELACSALTGVSADYDAAAFVGLGTQDPMAAMVGSQLRLEPKGPSAGRLSRAAAATVVGSSGDDVRRVVMTTSSYHAVGWMPRHYLSAETHFGTIGRARLLAMRSGLGGSPTCKKDITVMAQVGDERAEIGRIVAKAHFSRVEPQPHGLSPDVVAITSPDGWLRLAPGAALLVRAADLEGCRIDGATKTGS